MFSLHHKKTLRIGFVLSGLFLSCSVMLGVNASATTFIAPFPQDVTYGESDVNQDGLKECRVAVRATTYGQDNEYSNSDFFAFRWVDKNGTVFDLGGSNGGIAMTPGFDGPNFVSAFWNEARPLAMGLSLKKGGVVYFPITLEIYEAELTSSTPLNTQPEASPFLTYELTRSAFNQGSQGPCPGFSLTSPPVDPRLAVTRRATPRGK